MTSPAAWFGVSNSVSSKSGAASSDLLSDAAPFEIGSADSGSEAVPLEQAANRKAVATAIPSHAARDFQRVLAKANFRLIEFKLLKGLLLRTTNSINLHMLS